MSWVIPLLQFAYGFFCGVEQGYADLQTGRRLQYDVQPEYDWQEHMVTLSSEMGLRLVRVKSDSAVFEVQVHGQSYVVVLLRQGQTALISVCSCITFPNGRAPRDISAGLSRVNRRLERCHYELVNGDDGDFYCVQSRINLGRLSPDALSAGINEMLPHELMLDKYLVDNDYAR
jgi:hypothetical protein